MVNKNVSFVQTYDKTLLSLILLIIAFGVVMIYDSTAVFSHDVFGGAFHFVLLQLAWVLVGSVGFWFFYKFDYHRIPRISKHIFIVALAFLGLLAIVGILPCNWNFPFAPCLNGANRWFFLNPAPLPKIPAFGVLGFQPSEFAKLAMILFLASVLAKYEKQNKQSLIWYGIVAGLTSGFILLQPNMSTAVLLSLIATTMYFVSGASIRPLLIAGPVLLVLAVLFIAFSPYRRERFMTFMRPDGDNAVQSGYHSKQVLIALGSGQVFGVGFGQSRQKYQYLPEVYADSIFAIIGEELGLLGTSFVIFLFGFLFYKGYVIALNAPDLLGRLLSIGIVGWLGFQFFVNIAAMTKIIPLTGVPIPLISYGGSSTVFCLMGLGVLCNVSSNIGIHPKTKIKSIV